MNEIHTSDILYHMMFAAAADSSAALKKLRALSERYHYKAPMEKNDEYEMFLQGIKLINQSLGIESSAPIEP